MNIIFVKIILTFYTCMFDLALRGLVFLSFNKILLKKPNPFQTVRYWNLYDYSGPWLYTFS